MSGFAFVGQDNGSNGSTTNSIPIRNAAFNMTAGDLVVAGFGWGAASGPNTATVTGVTDTDGDTWTRVMSDIYTPNTVAGVFGFSVWAKIASHSNGVNAFQATATISASFQFTRVQLLDWSGGTGTLAVVGTPTTNSATGSAITNGAVTNTGSNDLFVFMEHSVGVESLPSASPFTQRLNGTSNAMYAQDYSPGSVLAQSFSGTMGGSTDWASVLFAVSGGAPPPPGNKTRLILNL